MSTIKQMIETHNAINGVKHVNSWKASKVALQTKIDDATTAATFVATADDDMLSIADVARSLNINPKIARAKLRRRGKSASDDGRWTKVKRDSKKHETLKSILMFGRKTTS